MPGTTWLSINVEFPFIIDYRHTQDEATTMAGKNYDEHSPKGSPAQQAR